MKNFRRIVRVLLLGALMTTLACGAQELKTEQVPTPEKMAILQNLTYLRVMQEKCPFPKQLADDFGFLSMLIGMQLAPTSSSEMDAVMVKAEAVADKNIAVSKEVACGRAEAAVRRLGEAVGGAAKKGG